MTGPDRSAVFEIAGAFQAPVLPRHPGVAEDFNLSVRNADKTLDLMTIEAYAPS